MDNADYTYWRDKDNEKAEIFQKLWSDMISIGKKKSAIIFSLRFRIIKYKH